MKGSLALALTAGAGVLLFLWNRGANVQTLTDKLIDALPGRLAQWAPHIARSATNTAPLAVPLWTWALFIAAVMDRESGGGVYLSPRGPTGTGDNGHGLGLMQLDDRYAGKDLIARGGDWQDAAQNIQAGAVLLHDNFQQSDSSLELTERLQRTADAYNAGPRVFALDDPDSVTTHHDYGTDVLARAARFEGSAA